MTDKLRAFTMMLLFLLTPFALLSIYYTVNLNSMASAPRQEPVYAIPKNGALYLDGATFYKVADGQNKFKIGTNFNLETRIRPETYRLSRLDKSVVLTRTSDKSLLDYYELYLEEVVPQNLAQVSAKPSFKVKFNVKRYPIDNEGVTLESKTPIPANEWSVIRISRLQNQIYLYVNNKVVDSRVFHGAFEYSRDGTNYIGAYHQTNEYLAKNRTREFFKGAVDYIKITDGSINLAKWDFNCSFKNSIAAGAEVQLYQGVLKFWDIASGGLSNFISGQCDKPIVPTPTPGVTFILLPSPTPTITPSPFPTFPNQKPYFESPDFIKNNQNNDYIQTKKSLTPYWMTFVAKDPGGDNVDIKINLESADLAIGNYLRVLPGRPSQCTSGPTPTPYETFENEKIVTLCGTLPENPSIISKSITVRYEATDGRPDGTTSGFYKIRVTQ